MRREQSKNIKHGVIESIHSMKSEEYIRKKGEVADFL